MNKLAEPPEMAPASALFVGGRHWAAVVTVAVVVIAFTFYGPFINNFFAFDDYRYIENLFSSLRTLFFGYNTTRFLSNLVFVPLYAVSGYNPFGYNLFSILLHIGNALLVAGLATRLSGKMLVGGLAGVLFAASAALADALLWKCANNTLMSTCFSLLAFHQYLEWRQTGKSGKRIASLLFFVAAMFSKEDAAALPMLIFCYEVVCRREKLRSIYLAGPYGAVVVGYLATAQLLIRVFGVTLEHYQRFLSFRPLYALFGGYSVFLMNPALGLPAAGLLLVAGALAVVAAFCFVKDRRLLLFALLGIWITFLPSSLTSLGSFTPKYIFQSVSRYLYFPSALAALATACILAELQQRLPKRVAASAIALVLCLYLGYNYRQVSARGDQWHEESEPGKVFLQAVRQAVPTFPAPCYVFATDSPMGRAYVQQSLRAFYQNPGITWIADPRTFTVPTGASAVIINCQWASPSQVQIELIPFSSKYFL